MKKTAKTNLREGSSQTIDSSVTATRWIDGRLTDSVMALSWIPFSLIALAMENNGSAIKLLMVSVFFFSFAHQPLTLVLVYGDPGKFELKRKLFTWSPLLFALAVVSALNIDLVVLAIFAGLWNVEHTLMQRYGITRIYGRMVGQTAGGIEIYMLFSWLILALFWAAADPATLDRVNTLGIGGANRSAFALLADLGSAARFMLPFVLGAVVILAIKWLFEEHSRDRNLAKHFYLASTLTLFIVMLVHPIAGFIGYVGSHALEYFIIVNRSLAHQYVRSQSGGGILGGAVRARSGRMGFFIAYLVGVTLLTVTLEMFASYFLYSMVFFTLGALHFFYDGFIWKLRQPAVARSVGAEL